MPCLFLRRFSRVAIIYLGISLPRLLCNTPTRLRDVNKIEWCTDKNLTTLEDRYICLLEMAVTGSLHDEVGRCNEFKRSCSLDEVLPYDGRKRYNGDDWPPLGHTMIGHLRLRNIEEAIRTCVNENIRGDFVELGVWRGGASIFAKGVLKVLDQLERRVIVFDAFESLPGYGENANFLANSQHTVEHNFWKYGMLDEGVIFIRGLFGKTLPEYKQDNPKSEIAVLRIDGNFYDSYQDAMYYLYEFVPVGGFVIFDDYNSHKAVQRFWHDFKFEQGLLEELITIDRHSVYFRKMRLIELNRSYFRAPQDANQILT